MRKRVQVLGAVLVFHALGVARGATGVAKAHGRILVDLRPIEMGGSTLDECFIVHRVWELCRPALESLLRGDDHFAHARYLAVQYFQQWQHICINNNDLIFSVIDDVFEILRRQTHV